MMSDYSLYDLEDTFWNEFVQTDDHIVPHPGHEYETDPELEGNINKRPRCDEVGGFSHTGENSAPKFVSQPKEEDINFQSLENIKNTMLDKESWSQTPNGGFSAPHANDTTQKMSPLCFQNSKGGAISSDAYGYPPAEMSPTENDLSFLDNDHEYGWPEIGNFEDVDCMFRNCDSIYGISSIGNDNELSWFSSSLDAEGSEGVLNSDFKFSSESSPKGAPEQYEASKLKHSQLVGNSNAEAGSLPQSSVVNEPSVSHRMTFMNDVGLKPKVQKGVVSNGNLQFKETKMPSVIHQAYTSPDACVQSHLQDHVYYMDYGDLTNQLAVNCRTSGARSEYPNSEYLNHPDTNKVDKKGKRLQQQQFRQPGLQSSCKEDANTWDHKKQIHKLIDGVSCGNPAEVASLYIQERCLESGLVDMSPEASSYRQLQQVTENLDMRMKLCIRDSLYRLARSAEQRNNQESVHGMHATTTATTRTMVVEGTTNFGNMDMEVDMETDTNPIDRSIAHLLFHRPPDSSSMPTQDGHGHGHGLANNGQLVSSID